VNNQRNAERMTRLLHFIAVLFLGIGIAYCGLTYLVTKTDYRYLVTGADYGTLLRNDSALFPITGTYFLTFVLFLCRALGLLSKPNAVALIYRTLFLLITAGAAWEFYLILYYCRKNESYAIIGYILMPALLFTSWILLTVCWERGFKVAIDCSCKPDNRPFQLVAILWIAMIGCWYFFH
jgi:hypothetical protein